MLGWFMLGSIVFTSMALGVLISGRFFPQVPAPLALIGGGVVGMMLTRLVPLIGKLTGM